MKNLILVIALLVVSTGIARAQTPEYLEQFYKSQQENIQTSAIIYFKIKTIPPLILRGGMDRVREREKWITNQLEMIPVVRESGNYDPDREAAVLNTIETFQKNINEPRIYHQEISLIATPSKRCQIIKKLSPGEPFEQTRIFDGVKSFLFVSQLGELHPLSNQIWFNPKEGLCRFGSDIGWWLNNGYTIAKENGYYTLVDSNGTIGASFLIDSTNENAWTQMIFADGRYRINASEFQNVNGLPVPNYVTVHQKLSDGTYYEIERLELLKAEINTAIDDNFFLTPTVAVEDSRLNKRSDR